MVPHLVGGCFSASQARALALMRLRHAANGEVRIDTQEGRGVCFQ